jgi:hypothetical protein
MSKHYSGNDFKPEKHDEPFPFNSVIIRCRRRPGFYEAYVLWPRTIISLGIYPSRRSAAAAILDTTMGRRDDGTF